MAHVPPLPDTGNFAGESKTLTIDGFLFDMDGTIIDSTDAIVKHWHKLGKELGVDPEVILHSSHGRRSVDTLALYDPSKANWEYVKQIEGAIPREYGSDAVEIPGARVLLDRLKELRAPWAIVTSGTEALMSGWLEVMKLPRPPVAVVAEDVQQGKPDPQCYRMGAERINLGPASRVLVVEDAPAGVKAGKAAGAIVLGLATTHTIDRIAEAGADMIVRDLRSVTVTRRQDQTAFDIEIRDSWIAT